VLGNKVQNVETSGWKRCHGYMLHTISARCSTLAFGVVTQV
jgi:hypothetical protein